VKGEFVGGCDIVTDQYQSGDLLELMKKHKLVE
jgi:glutaredoxin-related protein